MPNSTLPCTLLLLQMMVQGELLRQYALADQFSLLNSLKRSPPV